MNVAARILARRLAKSHSEIKGIDLLDKDFPLQTEFILHPAKFKALFATRRFGKSYTAGLYLIKEALEHPGTSCLYVALTRDSAKGIMWKDILKVLNQKYKLHMKFNETLLTATLPNGSVIYLMGADSSEDDKNKILGRKFKVAIIDEAASFTINMRELVFGILKPAMADLGGTICMIGTPSNYCRGLFFDITTGIEPGWHLVKANTADNPYMKDKWAKEIAELMANQPYITELPMFKQMYLGQWAIEEDKLVYKFNPDRNLYKEPPKGLSPNGWTYTLGVDTGWEDDNAFIHSMFHENDMNLYIFDDFAKPKMTFDQVTDKINQYLAHPFLSPSRIIIDGANKQGVESMRQRSNIPFEYADKNGKVDFIEMMNADFIQGKIKIHERCVGLINELTTLVWKTDGDRISIPKKEHPSLPNHRTDAMLYNWRNSYHYHSAPKEIFPAVGSPGWYQKQSDGIWERERERLIENLSKNWPEDDGSGWSSDSGMF
jgi:phage terminase large subunit